MVLTLTSTVGEVVLDKLPTLLAGGGKLRSNLELQGGPEIDATNIPAHCPPALRSLLLQTLLPTSPFRTIGFGARLRKKPSGYLHLSTYGSEQADIQDRNLNWKYIGKVNDLLDRRSDGHQWHVYFDIVRVDIDGEVRDTRCVRALMIRFAAGSATSLLELCAALEEALLSPRSTAKLS